MWGGYDTRIEISFGNFLFQLKLGMMTMKVDKLCFCKKGTMSECTAGSVDYQKRCRYYRKSSYSDKCMYFTFGKYCDCLAAQMKTAKKDAPEILWDIMNRLKKWKKPCFMNCCAETKYNVTCAIFGGKYRMVNLAFAACEKISGEDYTALHMVKSLAPTSIL